MLLLQSVILGIVQGIAEFLPISSSAHLVVVPYLFNWSYQGLVFDVALHFGTLLAIVIIFWKDWVKIISSAFSNNGQRKTDNDILSREVGSDSSGVGLSYQYPKGLFWMLILGTIPGGLAGVFLEEQAATVFRSPLLVAINLAIFGLIIYLLDRFAKRDLSIAKMTYGKTLIIGIAQMLALVPGVSRSGSTMAAGRAIGLKRQDAARFSFLLAAPIMLGTALFEARHFTTEMLTADFLIALVLSLVFGWLAIKYLLKYLERGNFAIFAWYRAALALAVIVVYLLR
jgi:undecaprenyl-diphosphatase